MKNHSQDYYIFYDSLKSYRNHFSVQMVFHTIFYDEPTNNLDKNNIDTILKMIQKFYTHGSSIIIVSHDDILIKMLKHNEILINKGCVTT